MKRPLKTYNADLHLHTVLSPCGDGQMVPELIFSQALKNQVKVLAITDHNSTGNLPAFLRCCPPEIWVIPGMEVQTKEEIHLICLFPGLEPAMEWGRTVRALLPPVRNEKGYFGPQIILDERGKISGEEELLLLNSIGLSLEETVVQVRNLGGIIYPAHIDRPAFSINSQIGFIPATLEFRVLEISARTSWEQTSRQHPGYTLVQASDAHYLPQIGVKTSTLQMAGLDWDELLLALNRQEGRDVILH
ncbi:MAG: PHP domain-containing protein [Firmicutes bacterium]|nr:PHP domain-containing protein [Bacillota bacterium]